MRRAARTDTNQSEIVEANRQLGSRVLLLHRVGQGCPDTLAGIHGLNILQEIKHGNAKLTGDEPAWHASWTGQVEIVRSVDEAIERHEYWRRVAEVLWEITRKI